MRLKPTQLLSNCLLRLAIAAFAIALLIGFKISPAEAACGFPTTPCFPIQTLGYEAQESAQVGLTGIQQQVWSIEDRLQCVVGYTDRNSASGDRPFVCRRRPTTASRPNMFAEEAPDRDPAIDSAFAALGYAGTPSDPKSPIPVKAPSPQSEPSSISFSTWAQGSIDYEKRSGFFAGTDIGRNTETGASIAAADVTFLHVLSASDGLVIGLLGGDITAGVHGADGSTASVNGPSVGAYGAYVNGGFSVDGTFKTDFLNIGETTAGVELPFGMQNYAAVGNVNLKQDMGSWWFQPTAGATYTRSVWNAQSKAFGMDDGTDVRVQGGIRFGSGFDWDGIHFSEKLSLLAYDDVVISGGTLVVALGTPLAPTDEGKLFGQVIGRLEAQLTQNWSVSVEGEIRGRTDVYGVAGRVGMTYLFN